MGETKNDIKILRSLAVRYGELAALDVQNERTERYYKTIAMERVRPVVLIDEVPWGEIRDEALINRCENTDFHSLETRLRQTLYQWDHFQADLVIPPEFRLTKKTRNTGIGLTVQDIQLQSDTGTHIVAHEYTDQLKTDDDLKKLLLPEVSFDEDETRKEQALAEEVFDGIMPVKLTGITFGFHIWDRIATFRGVDNLLMDLAVRPDFMHRTAGKFLEIAQAEFRQLIDLDLLDTKPMTLHCTPACARELPAPDFDGTVRPKDVWGRCSAQIFAAVSPEMHDEFDLAYNQELFGECGLLYYGCCEPLDRKIDILRKRFKNLRKISITPWADAENAAGNIGSDYILAAKPNPAFVNSPVFNPEPVEQEMRRYLDACAVNGTVCEFVLKDISTIANRPENLELWAKTVSKVIDQYY